MRTPRTDGTSRPSSTIIGDSFFGTSQLHTVLAMRSLGRLMQMLGLALGPLAIFLQLNKTISVAQLLLMGLASLCLFWLGRIIEGYAR